VTSANAETFVASPGDALRRIAGAPISWGVCEVPDWGAQRPAREVLADMRRLGLTATEFGPVGFLEGPAEEDLLGEAGLRGVGGFLGVVLFEDEHDPLPTVDAFVEDALRLGGEVVVLAAVTGRAGYDQRPVLSDAEWSTLLRNLDRVDAHVAARGMTATLHPHVGTLVENEAEVQRVLRGSGIALTLDTGHLMVGGADPLALARSVPERIGHVHLKDVDAQLAQQVQAGSLSFSAAVAQGIFRPLGEGDVGIADLVRTLEDAGYQGWYVLEQDVMLTGSDGDPDPVSNVHASLEHLVEVLS
jgi:inosose dehydratase